jgi:transcriptional regulator with XRE-family HTH domain
MANRRNYSPITREAARLLGERIRLARIQRRFTQAELAERVGVSTVTMSKIERGDLTVALGSVFEAAAIAGVTLFDSDPDRRFAETRRVRDLMALLPDQVHERSGQVRDDF